MIQGPDSPDHQIKFFFFFSIFKKIIYFFKKAGTANNLRKLIKNSNFWWREWRLVQFGMWEKLPITLLKTLRFSLEPKLIPPLQEDRSIRDGSIPSTLPLMNFQSEWSPIWSGFLSFFIKFFFNLTFFVKKKKKRFVHANHKRVKNIKWTFLFQKDFFFIFST